MASEWDEFEDATPEPVEPVASADPWAEFEDASPSKPKKSKSARKREKRRQKKIAAQADGVVDGDTLQLGGQRIRVLGADATEMGQPGYLQNGATTDLGAISRGALTSTLDLGSPQMGDVVGQSYGRTVAPVTVDGILGVGATDVGQAMIRSGNAVAAPGFINDPERRFDYVQAERLARANGLGPVNDYLTPRPDQYRDDPNWIPERETVAQFFDTPTPYSGLTADQEAEWLRLNREGTVEALIAYADANGFATAPEIAKRWVEYRDKERAEGREVKPTVNYDLSRLNAPPVLTDDGRGQFGAAVREGVQGLLAGGADEAGAVFDSLGATPGRENIWNSGRRFADIWSNNQAQNASLIGYDESAYPTTSAVAQLTGALIQPFPGGKLNSARKLGAWGAGYAGAEGFLGTEGDWTQRATAAAIQAPIGAVVGAVGGKAIEAAAPYARKAAGWAGDRVGNIAGRSGRRVAEQANDPWAEFADAVPERSIAMDAEPDSISAPARSRDYIDVEGGIRPQRMDQPLSEAQRRARAENIMPGDMVPRPSSDVSDVAEAAAMDAGRVVPAKPVNERTELKRQTIRNYMGVDVPKVGPVDMVGYLRTQGGLVDQGGELTAMGLNNAARKGMDHVGQEMRFGPLVNESGLTLDEAADRAWREGYFPDHTERPTVNEFLDALRETHEGTNRRWLPDDMPQLDRYDAAQTDRLDLEKRIAEEGPVYQDRSVPADEPAPLPPVEAYEGWGGKAPDFVDNIRLGKLETPQDITRALVQAHNRVGGFDAATRGRISQAETERLADELGMTADSLIQRRKGQAFNAEEALAARQLLAKSSNELVVAARRVQRLEDPGDEVLADFRQKWMRHVAIQEQVSGMTAEAGRALAQFKHAASSGAIKGNVLHGLVRAGGGKDGLQDAAGRLLEAVEVSPGAFNVLSEKLTKSKWQKRASELYINFLLSNPATHAVNMTSNALTAIAQVPEHAAAAVIGKAREAFSQAQVNRVTSTEVSQRMFGLLTGAREGAQLFARALRTGEASDFVSKVEGEEYKAIPGLLGEAARIPTRLLTAEDELFKGIARRMAINGLAVRTAHREGLKGEAAAKRISELMANPTDEMLEGAIEEGLYRTFQTKLGPAAQDISNFANRHMLAKVFLPFVRTPTNLLKYAAERSPAAPLLGEWRKDFAAGGARRDLALAKSLLGTGFGMAIYEGALAGRITGSPPTDQKKSRLLYADGWKPYSIKIGDTYYSYRRLDPFAVTMGTAADLATLPEGMSDKQREDEAALAIASLMGNLASKTWLSGVSDVVNALHDPARYSDNLLQRVVGSFLVPAGVAGVARAIDPVQRDVETIAEAIKARVPGLSKSLAPRRDVWGKPITSEGGVGPDFLSPIYVSAALDDPVNKELLQLDYAPGYPSRTVGGRELNSEEYDRYVAMAGGASHDLLTALVKSPEWKGMDDTARVKAAKKEVRIAREDARKRLFAGAASADDEDDEPAAAPTARAAPSQWDEFDDVPQRDVVGELEGAIPGVRFTSGFRTPEYQADMRRRGYKPAQHSGHLSGSDLDMLPPSGKSLEWLRAQVKRFEPKARLLIHDGHLHAEFPDYFAAPVFGKAVDAGIRNPVLASVPVGRSSAPGVTDRR